MARLCRGGSGLTGSAEPAARGVRQPDETLAERTGLVGSIVATAVLGAIGVAWGLVSGSQMIVLDGSP